MLKLFGLESNKTLKISHITATTLLKMNTVWCESVKNLG